MTTPAQNSFTDAFQAPLCTSAHSLITASRRGSACGSGCADDPEEKEAPRARPTQDQILVLEKQFMETPKPTTAMRLSIAQKTGMPVAKVGNWYQNRRRKIVKAKAQKKMEELQVMQVLESAGRRRVTEPSSPAEPQDFTPQKVSKPSGRPRAKSDSATARLSTTVSTQIVDMPSFSPYPSPTEACIASLARCLALAPTAMGHANIVNGMNDYSHGIPQPVLGGIPLNNISIQNLETPWQQPASAFSDWGSSRNSIAAYTPTPAGQLEDPFEFDNPSSNQNARSPFDSNAPVQDDYNMFAAAIEMNQYSRPFVMPAFSTSGLMKRRQLSPLCAEPQNSPGTLSALPLACDRRDSCASEFVATFGSLVTKSIQSDQVVQYTDVQSSLATRRNQICPTLLSNGPPSNRNTPFNNGLPVMEEEHTGIRQPHLIKNDSNDHTKDFHGLNTEQSPFSLDIFAASTRSENSISQKPAPLSSPSKSESLKDGESCCSPNPRLKQEEAVPELDFSVTSITPESATFDNHIPSVALLPDTYRLHLPEHQLYKHSNYPNYYDFPSEGSSASSDILLNKETNAFPFEEFLSARLNTKVKPLDSMIDHQQPLVYSQFGC